jgi:hypothetical protein
MSKYLLNDRMIRSMTNGAPSDVSFPLWPKPRTQNVVSAKSVENTPTSEKGSETSGEDEHSFDGRTHFCFGRGNGATDGTPS